MLAVRTALQPQSDEYIYTEEYGFPLIFKRLEDLTTFCVPKCRRTGSEYALNYSLGITVLNDRSRRQECLRENLAKLRYLSAPRVFPMASIRESFTKDQLASSWLRQDIAGYVSTYSLNAAEALSVLDETADRQILTFRKAFSAAYKDMIISPLLRMANVAV